MGVQLVVGDVIECGRAVPQRRAAFSVPHICSHSAAAAFFAFGRLPPSIVALPDEKRSIWLSMVDATLTSTGSIRCYFPVFRCLVSMPRAAEDPKSPLFQSVPNDLAVCAALACLRIPANFPVTRACTAETGSPLTQLTANLYSWPA